MAGQLFGTDNLGGFMYSDELSDVLRMAMQPRALFQQFCDPEDATNKGLHKGSAFAWDKYSDVATPGAALATEGGDLPETNFTMTQGTLAVKQFGNSIPWTEMLDNLAAHPVKKVIHKVLKNDAVRCMEREAHGQYDATLLTVTPATETSATAVTFEVTGTPTVENDVALNNTHCKLIVDEMKEREIPTYDGSNYMCISRTKTLRGFKDDIEALHSYVEAGFYQILNGEVGRSYAGLRFFEQSAIESETWTNGKSDAAYFFGEDTVMECVVVPPEIRGKIPTNYGLNRGLAWYALGGFGIVHNDTGAVQNRIVKWSSAL